MISSTLNPYQVFADGQIPGGRFRSRLVAARAQRRAFVGLARYPRALPVAAKKK